MAYSSLAQKAIISPNCNVRKKDIDSVSIHCPCSVLSLDSMGKIYQDSNNKSSCHYGIDIKGNIAVFVDESKAAMSLSSTGADNRSISVIVSASTTQSPYALTQASIKALQDLLVDICMRNNIKNLKWMNDADYGRKAGSGASVAKQNIFIHKWFNSKKKDPGKWIEDNMEDIISVVNTQLDIDRNNMRKILFIGDERVTRLHNAVGTDTNLWYTHKGDANRWTDITPFPFASEINNKAAVCILGGWSDPDSIKPKAYADKINTFAKACFSVGCAVYFASITPISEEGYKGMTNAKIRSFNKSMQKNLMTGVGYIDAYGAIQGTFTVTDGLHYDKNTNMELYGALIHQAARLTGGIKLAEALDLNPTEFKPYVAKFDRNADVNYKQLTNLGVVCAIIEAGYRFDSHGKRTEKFDNPNIEKQIENLEKRDIIYGMYTICRAKTVVDAKTEMQYFQYQLYRHPPQFGAWIDISNFGNSKKLNDSLLTQYNQSLKDLGFSGKMGIICSRNTLNNISWDTWQDEYFLYLIEHVKDVSVLDNLLDPELFDIDGTEPSSTSSSDDAATRLVTMKNASQITDKTTGGTLRQQLVTYSLEFIGSPYVWGAIGSKPGDGFDCSGFICAVYKHFGMDLTSARTTLTTSFGKVVTLANAQPGDVMHYPHHVAMYLGNNELIEAANEQVGVRKTHVYSGCDRIVNIIDNWKK